MMTALASWLSNYSAVPMSWNTLTEQFTLKGQNSGIGDFW
jgi:hypothetical protein